ncbi:hypothetical protein G5I_05329 [Acromyrmex echinatior]|uniref:Uncharacterized protein n=1 Tax=Acromyrmex echinatior TaxID=103372 RepID=F4WHY2_ACREC|nr:hypothetical protein G5I_05329 [Acromyrmex echinatior]
MESAEIRESAGPRRSDPTRCDAALRVPAFPAENGFRGAGRGAAALWHSGCRRRSVTIVYTHRWLQQKQQQQASKQPTNQPASQPATSDGYRAPAGRPAGFNSCDLPAQVSFRLISRLDDFLEQNPIDFTTKH